MKTSILLTLVAAIGCSVFAARGGFETTTAKHPQTLQVTENGGAADALSVTAGGEKPTKAG
ncbi:hypothetical protein [Pantoea agglomerans]|uniref:hypothetical protein n=1 Tax=Enterobacter agglomerans TaxID=549 RepID=UPI003C7E84A0